MSIYDIEVTTIEGQPHKMEAYHGKTLLIVNVASQCGYTHSMLASRRCTNSTRTKDLPLGFPVTSSATKSPAMNREIQRFVPRPTR